MNNVQLENLKKKCLVLDIETSSSDNEGNPIDIRTDFEQYVERAKVKFIGLYSYKYDKYICDEIENNEEKIKDFIEEHEIIVSFNGIEFDIPILYNNDLMPENKRFIQVDMLQILGSSTFLRKNGLPFKNRGALMGFKYKNNSLREMTKVMNVKTQKGDINYDIFFKNTYTNEEKTEIFKYLESDVKATKQIYDLTWDFWMPFTEFISDKNIMNLSWIKSSIASLTYKAACNTLDVEETYADIPESAGAKVKEAMGARVIEPKYEESKDIWYVDYASLYPHIYAMFNLFNEVTEYKSSADKFVKPWHGNDLFKVKGYYNILNQHKLSIDVAEKLKTRINLKETDPNNPMIYALKIFLNSLYGAQRSPIFEQIHTPNGGWDCCWLGQQINELTEKMMDDMGFETIAGDSIAKDTPILIKNNNQTQLIPIEDLFSAPKTNTNTSYDIKNKNILVLTDNGWNKIKYIYRHKTKKQMYRVLTRKSYVEVSEDHSFVINNKSVSPKELKIGDTIELIDNKLENKFDIDKDLCWLLGFWLAEGTTGCYNYKKYGIKYSWALNQKDTTLLKKSQEILIKFGLNTTILDTLKSSNCNKLVPKGNIKVFYELFKEWCLTKTDEKKIPSFILDSDEDSKRNFLKGYLDGDGHFDKKEKSWSFCSIDKSLFSGVCLILNSLGYEYSLKTRKDKPNVINARIIKNKKSKNLNQPNKILKIEKYFNDDNIYDIETENHHFCGGIGNVNLHNTDSIFIKAKKELGTTNSREYVLKCLQVVVDKIKSNVPFPSETFNIDIENYLSYVKWPFSLQPIKGEDCKNLKNDKGRLIKKLKGLKKNYLYLYEKKGETKLALKLVGLPIIKDNATPLGQKILEEKIKPMILENGHASFTKEVIQNMLNDYLKDPKSLKLLAREFKVKKAIGYKKPSQIQAQISEGYFKGQDGVISLIKLKITGDPTKKGYRKIGCAGKTNQYCIIQEAIDSKITMEDIDLTKIENELDPFIKIPENKKEEIKKNVEVSINDIGKNIEEKELNKFFESDLFDSHAVGNDISNKEYLENEIFFETM